MKMHIIPIHIAELEPGNYHLFVELFINNKPCRMLIDTGASKTVMDTDRVCTFLSKPDDLVAHHSKSVGLGVTEIETKVAILHNWKIKQFALRKFEVAVLPIGHVNQTYTLLKLPAIDGVLGSDFLMKYKAIINYNKQQLKLRK